MVFKYWGCSTVTYILHPVSYPGCFISVLTQLNYSANANLEYFQVILACSSKKESGKCKLLYWGFGFELRYQEEIHPASVQTSLQKSPWGITRTKYICHRQRKSRYKSDAWQAKTQNGSSNGTSYIEVFPGEARQETEAYFRKLSYQHKHATNINPPKKQTKNLSGACIGQMKMAVNTRMHAEFKWRYQNAELKTGFINFPELEILVF